MAKPVRTLASLAAEPDALEYLDAVVERMRMTTQESRFLEWKSTSLFGRSVTVRTKYRSVKAAVSFANTEGGFLLFGVDPRGIWIGLTEEEMAELDPAKVTELINGVIFPELPAINLAQFSYNRKKFAVIHIPPSAFIPHVTTRDISEIDPSGTRKIVLARHAVYYRHGAKSDAATPVQHQKIVEKRTMSLRDELLRRVREVPIPVMGHGRMASVAPGTTVTVARLTNDPSAPVVRITRVPGQTTGVLLYEELSDGIFEEINNVLDANRLLADTEEQFVFGEEIYYRVYAERQHVHSSSAHGELLLKTACREIYGPFLFWMTIVSPRLAAEELIRAVENPKHPVVLSALRAIVLLGRDATSWLEKSMDRRYKRMTQPPEFYWTIKRVIERTAADRRLLAMRTTPTAVLDIPDAGEINVSRLLATPEEAAAHLSRVCVRIFKGDNAYRGLARQLDIAAYGKQIEQSSAEIWREIQRKVKR